MKGKWTKENFEKFDAEHPDVYRLFKMYSLQAAKYRRRYSAKSIFHRLRWDTMVQGGKDYKIDDGWISHYARKFTQEYPEHESLFEFRIRSNSYHKQADAEPQIAI